MSDLKARVSGKMPRFQPSDPSSLYSNQPISGRAPRSSRPQRRRAATRHPPAIPVKEDRHQHQAGRTSGRLGLRRHRAADTPAQGQYIAPGPVIPPVPVPPPPSESEVRRRRNPLPPRQVSDGPSAIPGRRRGGCRYNKNGRRQASATAGPGDSSSRKQQQTAAVVALSRVDAGASEPRRASADTDVHPVPGHRAPLASRRPRGAAAAPSRTTWRRTTSGARRRRRKSQRRGRAWEERAKKDPFLACFFCRGRKIACHPKNDGGEDRNVHVSSKLFRARKVRGAGGAPALGGTEI